MILKWFVFAKIEENWNKDSS